MNKEIQLSTREITQWYLDNNDLSAAIGFLQGDTSTYARTLEIHLLINDQQYEEATQALGGMGTPTPELLEFYNLYTWINEIKEEGREYSEMSSGEEASLRNIAASNTKFAANAQAILWQVFEEEIIFPEPDLEENPLERKANPEYVKDFVFDIFPNPTENKIQVELDLKVENQDKVEIIMLNSVGVELKREQIKSNHYRSTYPVIDLPNGVYYLILKRNDLTIDHKKAVILR